MTSFGERAANLNFLIVSCLNSNAAVTEYIPFFRYCLQAGLDVLPNDADYEYHGGFLVVPWIQIPPPRREHKSRRSNVLVARFQLRSRTFRLHSFHKSWWSWIESPSRGYRHHLRL